MKIIKIILAILLIVWMLPQNIAGLILSIFTGFRYKGFCGGALYSTKSGLGCVSLGYFIFVTQGAFDKRIEICKHEYGHFIQSMILGPLYLFVIGIPSAIACMVIKTNKEYYEFYTEKWANHLADLYFNEEKFLELRSKFVL